MTSAPGQRNSPNLCTTNIIQILPTEGDMGSKYPNILLTLYMESPYVSAAASSP